MSARINSLTRPNLPARRQTGIFTKIAVALAVYEERRRLAKLPDHLLDDLGLTRQQALAESDRGIWASHVRQHC